MCEIYFTFSLKQIGKFKIAWRVFISLPYPFEDDYLRTFSLAEQCVQVRIADNTEQGCKQKPVQQLLKMQCVSCLLFLLCLYILLVDKRRSKDESKFGLYYSLHHRFNLFCVITTSDTKIFEKLQNSDLYA